MIIKFEIDTDQLAEHVISKSIEAFMPAAKDGVTEKMFRDRISPNIQRYFDNLNHNEIERLLMHGIADTMFPRKDESDE